MADQPPASRPETLELNDLLRKQGFDPATVLVMRHQPTEPALRRRLRWLASEDEPALIAYQSSHRRRTEAALLKARYIASFIADGSGRAIFVGLFAITGTERVPRGRWLENPAIRALVETGSDIGMDDEDVIWFHQTRAPFCEHWKGRLVVAWPPPERAWYRWADRNSFAILAIHEDDELIERMVPWDQLVLGWAELSQLPRRHRQVLRGWRGIYLIRDKADGKLYVGSAYGADNILGRWENYAQTGHGDNIHLRRRSPESFEFSILERLVDNVDEREVIAKEAAWKKRLGSAWPQGLNGN